MRVKVTVYYGEEDISLSKETRNFDIPTEEDDADTFEEAKAYLAENVVEAYTDDGYPMEDDPEEEAIGIDYVAAWVVTEPFDRRDEARDILAQIIEDTEAALSDLE